MNKTEHNNGNIQQRDPFPIRVKGVCATAVTRPRGRQTLGDISFVRQLAWMSRLSLERAFLRCPFKKDFLRKDRIVLLRFQSLKWPYLSKTFMLPVAVLAAKGF